MAEAVEAAKAIVAAKATSSLDESALAIRILCSLPNRRERSREGVS